MNNRNEIRGFRDDYRFLSNFYPCKISYNELVFSSVEAAFQAAKCVAWADRIKFQELPPADAKRLGKRVILRNDWENVKLAILCELVRLKFMDNPELLAKLLGTGDALLVEDNSWHDNFYGNCTCNRCRDIPGKNHLGLALMNLRDALMNPDAHPEIYVHKCSQCENFTESEIIREDGEIPYITCRYCGFVMDIAEVD